MEGSFTVEKIGDRIDSLRREYENICRSVPEFTRYTHWEFVWARLVVITRIFGLMIKTNKTDGLVPYADMLNHKRPRESAADAGSACDVSVVCHSWVIYADLLMVSAVALCVCTKK